MDVVCNIYDEVLENYAFLSFGCQDFHVATCEHSLM
jgi:hypothetical protein